MTKRVCLGAVLVFVLAAPSMAQRDRSDRGNRGDRISPGWLARRCIATMEMLADRTVHHIASRTHYCIRTVNALIESGSDDDAHVLARRCTESIGTTARKMVARTEQLTTRCINRLTELGASDEMIHSVRRAGANSVEGIQSAAVRATNAIQGLFDEPI